MNPATADAMEVALEAFDELVLACSEVGWHFGVPMAAYLAIDAASSSGLRKLGSQTPKHLRHALDSPKPSTPAQSLGSATHTGVLERERFVEAYTYVGQCQAELKSGKRCSSAGSYIHTEVGWVCGTHLNVHGKEGEDTSREIITEKQYEAVLAMRESVWAHPMARALLQDADGVFEGVYIWRDEATGVLCKMRPDAWIGSRGAVVDVKSTSDASYHSFQRTTVNYGYHEQGGFYRAGIEDENPAQHQHHYLIAVESDKPHAVAVYRLNENSLDAGQRKAERNLARYAECKGTGVWPGFSDQVEPLSIPDWAIAEAVSIGGSDL